MPNASSLLARGDRVIVSAIATAQLLVSIVCLYFVLIVAYGALIHTFFPVYFFVGIISAALLFNAKLVSRLLAMAWQIALIFCSIHMKRCP
jgi:hypothetical protein